MLGNIFAYRQHGAVNNKLAFKMQWRSPTSSDSPTLGHWGLEVRLVSPSRSCRRRRAINQEPG